MLLARHLRRHRATWLSRQGSGAGGWCSPSGAVAIGIAAVLFAHAADLATELFGWLREPLALPAVVGDPAGVCLVRLGRPALVRRCAGQRHPAGDRRPALTRPGAPRALLGARVTIGKVALTVVGLAVGASIGREGPTVQVGAAIMLAVAGFAGIGQVRGLVLAGAAAGVAAAFNTPLAGVVFAIEEMAKEFEHRISGPIVGAVVLAGITGLALVGDYRYFGQTTARSSAVAQDWLAVPLCGIVGGVLGGLFSLGVVTDGHARAMGWSRHSSRGRSGSRPAAASPWPYWACSPTAMPTAPPTSMRASCWSTARPCRGGMRRSSW